MTWEEFGTLVTAAVAGGIITAYLVKAWNLQYRVRLTVMRR